jgi:hypothetical protein
MGLILPRKSILVLSQALVESGCQTALGLNLLKLLKSEQIAILARYNVLQLSWRSAES